MHAWGGCYLLVNHVGNAVLGECVGNDNRRVVNHDSATGNLDRN